VGQKVSSQADMVRIGHHWWARKMVHYWECSYM